VVEVEMQQAQQQLPLGQCSELELRPFDLALKDDFVLVALLV
jgi:hypothetical protein